MSKPPIDVEVPTPIIHPIDDLTEKFAQRIRHAVWSANENGEFMEHFISPAVMTEDWPIQAAEFVRRVCDCEESATIRFDLKDKMGEGLVQRESWLCARVLDSSLPLALYTKKEDDNILKSCLDKIVEEVHGVLQEMFPRCQLAPLKTTDEIWHEESTPYPEPMAGMAGNQLQQALKRVDALREQGASTSDIHAEMEKIRAIRRTRRTKKFEGPPKKIKPELTKEGTVVEVYDTETKQYNPAVKEEAKMYDDP